MVRREAYEKVKGYSVEKKLLRVEDYHLWFKMYSAGYKGHNLQEALYKMRDDSNAIQRRKFKYRINEAYVKRLIIKNFDLPIKKYSLCCKTDYCRNASSNIIREIAQTKNMINLICNKKRFMNKNSERN